MDVSLPELLPARQPLDRHLADFAAEPWYMRPPGRRRAPTFLHITPARCAEDKAGRQIIHLHFFRNGAAPSFHQTRNSSALRLCAWPDGQSMASRGGWLVDSYKDRRAASLGGGKSWRPHCLLLAGESSEKQGGKGRFRACLLCMRHKRWGEGGRQLLLRPEPPSTSDPRWLASGLLEVSLLR